MIEFKNIEEFEQHIMSNADEYFKKVNNEFTRNSFTKTVIIKGNKTKTKIKGGIFSYNKTKLHWVKVTSLETKCYDLEGRLFEIGDTVVYSGYEGTITKSTIVSTSPKMITVATENSWQNFKERVKAEKVYIIKKKREVE